MGRIPNTGFRGRRPIHASLPVAGEMFTTHGYPSTGNGRFEPDHEKTAEQRIPFIREVWYYDMDGRPTHDPEEGVVMHVGHRGGSFVLIKKVDGKFPILTKSIWPTFHRNQDRFSGGKMDCNHWPLIWPTFYLDQDRRRPTPWSS